MLKMSSSIQWEMDAHDDDEHAEPRAFVLILVLSRRLFDIDFWSNARAARWWWWVNEWVFQFVFPSLSIIIHIVSCTLPINSIHEGKQTKRVCPQIKVEDNDLSSAFDPKGERFKMPILNNKINKACYSLFHANKHFVRSLLEYSTLFSRKVSKNFEKASTQSAFHFCQYLETW